ncbi:Arylsulphatase [Corynespora cassiicola Philippines]|uniref:Arylsulfatase n=1 Tax=Corynespora cassiicola Philippines TaxID=1448308 RepID=A0A2T2NFL3_CORCC|nr:Arylsulphatase [Corynespora cassiicola Philippines]
MMLVFPIIIILFLQLWHLQAETTMRPNVVFIFTDDQDAKLNSLDYMPVVQKQMIEQGTLFENHYCTVSLCCPSRVSLWTGLTAHNTNVTNVMPPYGGYPKFHEERLNESWVPLWLQQQGYQTYYVGKLMNHQNILNYDKPFISGFNGSDFLVEPNAYNFMFPYFQRNQDPPVKHENEYSTDLVHQKSIGFLNEAMENPDSPFFLTIAPIAPHFELTIDINVGGDPPIGARVTPPVPAERHTHLFSNVTVPRTPNFNPDIPSGVDWIAEQPMLSAENITYNDEWYRRRLQSLQAVDEMVEDVIAKLEEHGLLDNTYIFYSSDNGYHIGHHRLPPGKGCGFEEDINVPLVVRGPNVPKNRTVSNIPTSHTDLAPTWWKLLGIPLREEFDGSAIPLTNQEIDKVEFEGTKEHLQVEFWSTQHPGEYANEREVNNTYKGLRILGADYGFYYSVWCSGSHELYDMKADPYQMQNLFPVGFNQTVSLNQDMSLGNCSYPLSQLATRLDALLLVLKTCKGAVCYDPWSTLLPNTGVSTLVAAMDQQFDEFFAGIPRVEYDHCEAGYLLEAEGPL